MATRREKLSPEVEEELRKMEREKIVVAKVRANKAFMDGIRESLAARARGERGIPYEELKEQIKRRGA